MSPAASKQLKLPLGLIGCYGRSLLASKWCGYTDHSTTPKRTAGSQMALPLLKLAAPVHLSSSCTTCECRMLTETRTMTMLLPGIMMAFACLSSGARHPCRCHHVTARTCCCKHLLLQFAAGVLLIVTDHYERQRHRCVVSVGSGILWHLDTARGISFSAMLDCN